MARHYINSSGESVRYSPREQKKRTMQALGLEYGNPTDNRTYKSIYDDLTRRVRQYNILQDLPEKTRLKPADVLFDIAFDRLKQGVTTAPTLSSIQTTIRQRGDAYSPTIQNLYNQSLQSNTRLFAERVRQSPNLFFERAVQNELNVFGAFLNTRGVDNDYAFFYSWYNEPVPVYIDKETGEIFTAPPLNENGLIDLSRFMEDTAPRSATISDIHIVRDKLKELAEDRKRKFKRVYTDRENNIYHYEVRGA